MYTRSYAGRSIEAPLPPDYGGTALTLKPPTDEAPTRSALTRSSGRGNAFGRDIAPRYPQLTEDEGETGEEKIEPPFGIYGQNGEGEDNEAEIKAFSEEVELTRCDDGRNERPLIDLSRLKSDDLLLLGLAFLIFTDKDRDGETPVDALLILATLFLSGL